MKPILYKASKVKNYKIKIISKTLTKFNIELSAQYSVYIYTNRDKSLQCSWFITDSDQEFVKTLPVAGFLVSYTFLPSGLTHFPSIK